MTRRGATVRRQWPTLSVRLPSFDWLRLRPFVLGACAVCAIALVVFAVRGLSPERVQWSLESDLLFQDESELMAMLQPFQDISFWRVELHAVEAHLATLPWVAQATVTRRWPDQIAIAVREQTPLAYWNDEAFINSRGDVFGPSDLVFELPRLAGPDGQSVTVMTNYLQFSQMFSLMGQRITALELAERGAWTVYLDNGVVVYLGRQDILQRARRVARVLGDLDNRAEPGAIAVMDARYQFGVAVQWKTEAGVGETV